MHETLMWIAFLSFLIHPWLIRVARNKDSEHRQLAAFMLGALILFQFGTLIVPLVIALWR